MPSLAISGSKHQFFEGLNFVTKEQPELNLQCYTQTPTLAFTYESTPSQRPFEINQDTQNWTSDLFFQPDKQTGVNLLNRRGEEAECYDLEEMIPAVVITQPEEDLNQSENTMLSTVDMVSSNVSPSDSTEFTSSDLQSLKSDTVSLISGKSDDQEGPEEDTQSVTASSVMSLFHRMQMDPVEKEWLRCAALGKYSALYILLQQDNTLVSKKTALHWAAKQGRVEMADMMARCGADVNQRAGYTPLHLASLHGHSNIIQLLINNYNAKVNIRDYHGKRAAHYWNGNMDIFCKHGSHSGGRWSGGRRGQCYAQLSALLSRSRSHSNISVMGASPIIRKNQSPSP
nr:ankyrin repeat domain-containing protein SOWAHC isoform X4 [Misgurnus anguillicaudatus]XP_055048818.1 ankyrin repeat domain-containing protein SOWAHC isoform X4 [Misgurnus anguillicaudatus]XP_055048819.1 ankyrin repeat domain-containing protein SOWAHC isoform X4 [Misgurnus anguillicaudatus]